MTYAAAVDFDRTCLPDGVGPHEGTHRSPQLTSEKGNLWAPLGAYFVRGIVLGNLGNDRRL